MRFLLVLLACAIAVLGQQPAPLRVHVNLVNVAFSVRNTYGVLVSDLARDDFEVFEDGAPQKIEFFARSADIPLALGLVADFSGSQEHFLKPHHRDLQTFLDTVLGPRDRAFLLGFGNHLRLLSDFSPSSSQLMQALAEYEHGHGHYPELGPNDEDREAGTAFYDAIYYSAVEKLAGASDTRKALVVFSDGEDNSSAHHMLDAIEAAQSENVQVFGIRYTQREHGHLTPRNKYGTSVMHRIAQETGAADFDAREGDIQTWFEQIAQELRSSYELAYYPAATASPDGSFHKITIRPKWAGLAVRCKTGYFATTVGGQQ
jgi:Ca-activated chloride channel family protein